MLHGEGVAMPGLKSKGEPRQPHGRKAPSLRPCHQEHQRGKHRQRLGDEIVAEARAEQHLGDCREDIGRICRVAHVGCFKREPTKQREKCREQANPREQEAASLDRVGITGPHQFQPRRGNERDE